MSVSADFWATTAQVMPTLLLAYVVKERWRPDRNDLGSPALDALLTLLALGLAVGGEFAAIRGLLGDAGVWSARFVVLTIGGLVALILEPYLEEAARLNMPGRAEIESHRFWSLFLGVALLLATLAVELAPVLIAVWVAVTL